MALDLNDKTANANNLTNNNTVADVTTSLNGVAGNTDAAGFTAASSQYFSATWDAELKPAGSFSVEFWIKYSGANTFDYSIFQSGGVDNTAAFFNGIFIRGAGGTAGKPQFLIGGNGAGDTGVTAATAINDGTWHHVACTWDGTNMRIYLNGSSTADATAAGQNAVYSGSGHFYIGTRSRDNDTKETYLTATLDDVRFWSTARTGAQIAANYNKQLTGSETGLISYWPFNTAASLEGGSFLLNFV